jgi:acyl-CoA reductase-like NAD-dependent aldehyde dehydrogenase
VSRELVKLFWQAGVPRDGLQILYGRGQVGAMLVDSEIDMVSFTGSSEVGKEIANKCSERFVKYVLELGGSSPAIICQDADLDLAVKGVLYSRFDNCGQACSAIKRVLVEEVVADQFIEKLVEKAKLVKVGDPMEKETDMGPLVSAKQLKKLEDQVTRGVIQGGRILAGGRRMREEPYIKGFYHEATVMVHLTSKMEIMQEEVFGPVLAVMRVNNFSRAIKRANQTKYGLTAAVFTNSKKKAARAMKELEAGAVCVNEVDAWNVRACWSGLKESGVGVELGKHGIWEYTNKKQMKVNFSKEKKRKGWWEVKEPVIEETVEGL